MFVRLLCQAARLTARKKELLKEKLAAINESQGIGNKFTCKQKYRRYCINLRERTRKRFLKLPRKSCLYKSCLKLRHEGTLENFTLKSIAGFIGGFFLTYIFFMFFVLQLNFKLSTATIMCSFFGSILTIGLAFSYKVRCIVFLVLPQFFSKRGRQALLAYAYILAITGPCKNTLNNMSILGESLACGQEQLKSAVRQIVEVIKKPFYAIRDAIRSVVASVKILVVKLKEILLSIKRIIMTLVKIIKSAFEFLGNVINMCNKEVGTPFQRCQRVFEEAIVDCNAKLGPLFNWLCSITYLVKGVCYIVKLLDYVCILVDFIKDTVSGIMTKVKQFIRHIRTMFYVRIKFSHSYHFESNHSKSMTEITTGIVTEIKHRSSGLMKFFDYVSSATSIFFIFMIVKVIYYRHNFLTNERFDNKFITKDFRQIDLRRAKHGVETVLPLNHRERLLYITPSSCRLVNKEKHQLSQSAMILLMATMKLGTHMATDYSLYWIMTLLRFYGRFQSKIEAPNMPTLNISGEGFLADLLKAIVKAFQPVGLNLEIDTVPCLPDPLPPDYDRYIQIGTLMVLCWFLAIFEPYGLRFRNSIMCYYHPVRAKERAVWLYNNIMRSRSSFLKFARRQLRRKVTGNKQITKITFMEFLRAKLNNFPLCRMILGPNKNESCLLCGTVFREGEKVKPIKCKTPSCPGIYCEQCYEDLQNLCTVCLDPIQYGDLSDISQEKDSSEDEVKIQKKKIKAEKKERKKKLKKKRKKKKKKDDKEIIDKDFTTDEDDDQAQKLIRDKGKPSDSDYFSSTPGDTTTTGYATDYSYTYQYNKDIYRVAEIPDKYPFKDIENQTIPSYASMDSFREEPVITIYSTLHYNSSSSSNITGYKTSKRTELIEFSLGTTTPKDEFKSTTSKSEEMSHNISTQVTESSDTSSYASSPLISDLEREHPLLVRKSDVETIELLQAKKSFSGTSHYSTEMETTFTDYTMDDKSEESEDTYTIYTDTDNKYGPVIVPKLNLEFVNNERHHPSCKCFHYYYCNYEENVCFVDNIPKTCNCRLFKHKVNYDEICETRRTRSSYEFDTSESSITKEDYYHKDGSKCKCTCQRSWRDESYFDDHEYDSVHSAEKSVQTEPPKKPDYGTQTRRPFKVNKSVSPRSQILIKEIRHDETSNTSGSLITEMQSEFESTIKTTNLDIIPEVSARTESSNLKSEYTEYTPSIKTSSKHSDPTTASTFRSYTEKTSKLSATKSSDTITDSQSSTYYTKYSSRLEESKPSKNITQDTTTVYNTSLLSDSTFTKTTQTKMVSFFQPIYDTFIKFERSPKSGDVSLTTSSEISRSETSTTGLLHDDVYTDVNDDLESMLEKYEKTTKDFRDNLEANVDYKRRIRDYYKKVNPVLSTPYTPEEAKVEESFLTRIMNYSLYSFKNMLNTNRYSNI